jgi:drug/metabolite transporter superfamily protein YnfA
MEKKSKHRYGRVFSAGFGLLVVAVALTWLGQVAGIVPAHFDPLAYACPACMAIFGVWIVAAQFLRKSGNDGEGRDVQM